jgi:prepilin-type processing-associated H-X9-DG protein
MGYINRDLNDPLGRWASSYVDRTRIFATLPPNLVFRYSTRDPHLGILSKESSSFHPGGVHLLMGDGSARLIKETIDCWPIDLEGFKPVGTTTYADGYGNLPPSGVWQKMTTRSGGEVYEDP